MEANREAGSERNVEQIYEPMHRADAQEPDLRHTVPDERACDREVRIHQGHWL